MGRYGWPSDTPAFVKPCWQLKRSRSPRTVAPAAAPAPGPLKNSKFAVQFHFGGQSETEALEVRNRYGSRATGGPYESLVHVLPGARPLCPSHPPRSSGEARLAFPVRG